MKIGILGAIETEIAFYLKKINNPVKTEYAKRTFYEGEWEGKEIVLVAAGMGKVNAAAGAQALISRFGVTHLIVSGVAGGIDTSLRIGDTVIADKVYYHDLASFVFEDHPIVSDGCFLPDERMTAVLKKSTHADHKGKIVCGTVVTGDAFIEKEGRERIISDFSPMCTDMETAAVAHICHLFDVPFAVVRSVSDTEEESGFDTFEANCKKASLSSYLTVESIIAEL